MLPPSTPVSESAPTAMASAGYAVTGGGAGGRVRLLSLDALRGLAVVLMVEQHLIAWFWNGPVVGNSIFEHPVVLAMNLAGGGAAPLFVTLAGAGASLMVAARQKARQDAEPEGLGVSTSTGIDRTLAIRGVALLAFAYGLNLLAPGWFSLRSWYVLHLMGLGLVTMPLWRRLSNRAVIGAGVMVLAATAGLHAAVPIPEHLGNDYMAGRSPLNAVSWLGLRLALLEGQFPILPWLTFFLVGVVAGRWLASGSIGRLWMLAAFSGGAGVAMAGGSLLLTPSVDSFWWRAAGVHVPFFPTSPSLALMLVAGVVAAIAAGVTLEQRQPLRPQMVMVTLGRASLTVLIVHIWVFRELARTGSGWQQAVFPDAVIGYVQWWQAFDSPVAVSAVAVVLVVTAALTMWWQRHDYRFGAEWLLRKVAP